jgi:hypothetical protein
MVAPTIMAAIVAVPTLPLVAPITTMTVMHIVPTTVVVEDIIAMAGIPETVVPTAAKADVIKSVAVVAVVIAVKLGIWVAIIIIIAIAIAGITKADIINATGQTNRG